MRRFALVLRSSLAESRSHAAPWVWPAEVDRYLSWLALLTDITTHLNALNVKLQGKDIVVTDMHAHITAFDVKLRLWEAQLANGQLEHFIRLAACVPGDVEPDTCVSVVTSLSSEFDSRFAGVRLLSADYNMFTPPPPSTFPRTTPLPPADEIGGATVQWWTEGEVIQLFSTVLLPRHRPPF